MIFDRFIADFADAVTTGCDTAECCIKFNEQLFEVCVVGEQLDCRGKLFAPIDESGVDFSRRHQNAMK
jgi:hypothetical protein